MKPPTIVHRLYLFLTVTMLAACGGEGPDATETPQSAANDAEQSPASSARPVHWSYSEDGGPAGWGQLSSAYRLCAEGKHQSPIDIRLPAVSGEKTWSVDYDSTFLAVARTEHVDDILDNGHTIQVSVHEGGTLNVAGRTYRLKQFHFHTPSEHTVNGQSLPMEMHLVHTSDDGALAVVGILFKEGDTPNANIAQIVSNLPSAAGETNHVVGSPLVLEMHSPADATAYHYSGSLTTPPCSESVQWLVLQQMVTVTADQVAAISSRIGPNNRPTQPLNDRTVATATVAVSTEM